MIDRNMCTTKESIKLSQPGKLTINPELSVSIDGSYNINCRGAKTGTVTLTSDNSVGDPTYLWVDGYKGDARMNLGAGTYRIIVTDLNNCQADTTVTPTAPDPLGTAFKVTLPFCTEKPDGAIDLEVTGGVRATDYTYRWSDKSASQDIIGILPGLPE